MLHMQGGARGRKHAATMRAAAKSARGEVAAGASAARVRIADSPLKPSASVTSRRPPPPPPPSPPAAPAVSSKGAVWQAGDVQADDVKAEIAHNELLLAQLERERAQLLRELAGETAPTERPEDVEPVAAPTRRGPPPLAVPGESPHAGGTPAPQDALRNRRDDERPDSGGVQQAGSLLHNRAGSLWGRHLACQPNSQQTAASLPMTTLIDSLRAGRPHHNGQAQNEERTRAHCGARVSRACRSLRYSKSVSFLG